MRHITLSVKKNKKITPKYLKVLCCEHLNDFLRENIPESEVHSNFFQFPHKTEEHEHAFVPWSRTKSQVFL